MKSRRYKRWISIGSNDPFLRTLHKCQQLGMGIVNGGKPCMVSRYGLALIATPEQMRELEIWWRDQGISWWKRQPRGAWPVSTKGEAIPWKEALENAKRKL